MTQLITDVLDYATLKKTKKAAQTNLDLNKEIESVLFDLKAQIADSGAIIQSGQLPVVSAIPIKVNQLFLNLISNAIKFRKKEGDCLITISAEEKSDHWQLAIQDKGIGIEQEHLGKIFEPFKKLHANTQYPGSGIGLASCLHIVKLHKGEIWVESALGEGTTFYFTLPKKKEIEPINKKILPVAEEELLVNA